MRGIFLKNYYFYKRNFTEIISQFVMSLLQVLPIYLMLVNQNVSLLDRGGAVLNYLLACCILNVIVGVNFEYYREIVQGKDIELKLAGISNFQYALAQTIFYVILNIFIFLLSLFVVFKFYQIGLFTELNLITYFELIIYLLVFIFNCVSINSVLVMIVKKTSRFSFSSLVCNILLILSGCYNHIDQFQMGIKILCYLNPFTYFVSYIKSMIGLDVFSFNIYTNIFLYICTSLLLYLVSMKMNNNE